MSRILALDSILNALRSQESSSKVLKLSHLYVIDHVIQTFYTLGFARHYWYEVPHDGRRVVNSQAQEDLIRLAVSRGEVSDKMPDNIAEIARGLWEKEEGTARVVLFLSWLIKVCPRPKRVQKIVEKADPCVIPSDLLYPRPLLVRSTPPIKHVPRPPSLLLELRPEPSIKERPIRLNGPCCADTSTI